MCRDMGNCVLASALKKRGSLYVPEERSQRIHGFFFASGDAPHLWGHTANKQSSPQQWFCFSSVLRVSQQRGKQGGAGVEPGTETEWSSRATVMKGKSSGYKRSGSPLSPEKQLDYQNTGTRKKAGNSDGHCAAFMSGTLDWRQAHCSGSGADGRLVLTSLKRVKSLNGMVAMTSKLENNQNWFLKPSFFFRKL